MTDVLLVCALAPLERALADAIARFRELGCTVTVVTFPNVDVDLVGVGPDEVRFLRAGSDAYGATFWRDMYAEGRYAKRVWSYVAADDLTMARGSSADVLVAVDNHAVFSVWNLAQRNKSADARLGLEPGLEAARRRSSGAGRPASATSGRRAAPAARGWRGRMLASIERRPGLARRLASSPRVPDALRLRLARVVLRDLADRGHRAEVTRLAQRLLSTTDDRLARANLLGDLIADDLGSGRDPILLREAVTAEFELSNERWQRDERSGAAGSFMQATRIAFHRAAHFDSVSSPLAADPVAFTEPLRHSAIYRIITAEHGRERPAQPGGDGVTRVLVAHHDNPTFLGEVLDSLNRDDVEIIVTDPGELGSTGNWTRNPDALLRSLSLGDGRAEKLAEENLRPLFDWADVIFVEWCTPLAWAFTLIDPGTTRIVVRLHSFEAFSIWPHLVDYSRIDALVFVSEHLKDLVETAVPRLRTAATERLVIPNGVNLRGFVADKTGEARFNLGLVGLSSVAKDVLWAFDVVRRLRAVDERFRLHLVGADLPDPSAAQSAAARRYSAAYQREVAELEAAGAVVRLGQLDDVGAALREIGVILSTSVRESQHLGLLEGAASGAVPVVRDWPFFAGMAHGPRTLFPAEWVVDTPEEAAERIIAVTADQDEWRRLGAEASAVAIERFDISTHHVDFQKLLAT